MRVVVFLLPVALIAQGTATKAPAAKATNTVRATKSALKSAPSSKSTAPALESDEQNQVHRQAASRLENKPSQPVNGLVRDVSLNIIAAIIFWIAFQGLPERYRRNKLRPKLELGLYQVLSALFAMFDLVMTFKPHSPSSYQNKIRGKTLRPEEIELGLQNKCLNNTFLYDEAVRQCLIPIGREMFEIADKIDQAIERIFSFSNNLSTTEILLLEQIRGKLEAYDLKHHDRGAAISVGTAQYFPVNPSLSYLKTNLAELYGLFGQLQDVAFINKYEDRNLLLDRVQSSYEQGHYQRCKHLIHKGRLKYIDCKELLMFYQFLCEYKGGNELVARRTLEVIIEGKPDLVSSRGFLADVIGDCSIREIIQRHYTGPEVDRLFAVIREESGELKHFIVQANGLREYYMRKATQH
jgi:hypothetical protein